VEFQQNTGNGRILALDLGKKRIGLALSDPLGISAQGLDTLQRTTVREDIAALEAIAREHQVQLVLLGHPLNMSGAEGRQAVYTRDFAQRLTERTGLAVRFWD
jgi:putative Holliday junction resolvase